MARSILVAGAIIFTFSGLGAFALAAFGAVGLERLLPPLSIDTDALRGAIIAIGAGFVALGLIHAGVVLSLARGHRLGWTVGILMGAVLGATALALAAAAFTSAVARPADAPTLVAAGAGALLGAAAYAAVGVALVSEVRSGSAD